MTRVRTVDGDVLDAICFAHYGRQDMVETVLDVNPGLAERGTIYPAGLIIRLPAAPARPARAPVRLWGAS